MTKGNRVIIIICGLCLYVEATGLQHKPPKTAADVLQLGIFKQIAEFSLIVGTMLGQKDPLSAEMWAMQELLMADFSRLCSIFSLVKVPLDA